MLELLTTTVLLALCSTAGQLAPRPQAPASQEAVARASAEGARTARPGVTAAVAVRIQERDAARASADFDVAAWERRLVDPDLRARERAFDQLARRASDWPQARQWLVEQAAQTRGDLAWTCRLLLRETERRADTRSAARGAETIVFEHVVFEPIEADSRGRLRPRDLESGAAGRVITLDLTGNGERFVVRSFESVLEELSDLDRRSRPQPAWPNGASITLVRGDDAGLDESAVAARDLELRRLIDELVPAPARVERSTFTIEYVTPAQVEDPGSTVFGGTRSAMGGAESQGALGRPLPENVGRRGTIMLRLGTQGVTWVPGEVQLPNGAGSFNDVDARTQRLLTGVVLPLVSGRIADGTAVDEALSHSISVGFDRLGVLVVEEHVAEIGAPGKELESSPVGTGGAAPLIESGVADEAGRRDGPQPPDRAGEVRSGLLILDVEPGSLAEALGLRGGDRLIAIDGAVLDEPEQISERLRRGARAGRIAVRWWRASDGQMVERGFLAARPLAPTPTDQRPVPDPNATDPNATDPNATVPSATVPNATVPNATDSGGNADGRASTAEPIPVESPNVREPSDG
jgi:hypothetical protein